MNNFFEVVLSKILGRDASRLKCVPFDNTGDYVVFIHGLNRSARSLRKLQKAFSEKGYQVINVSYPSRKYPIEIFSHLFLGKILKKYCVNKKKKIHFVTHSLGGIVLRKYLLDMPLLNIGRVVMIAPPNHGSEWADFLKKSILTRWILGIAGQQLGSHGNSYVNQLPRKISCDLGVIACTKSLNPLSSWIIKGKNDGTVTVRSTKIVGMKDFVEVKASHFFAPYNIDVINHTLHFIDYGYFFKDPEKHQHR